MYLKSWKKGVGEERKIIISVSAQKFFIGVNERKLYGITVTTKRKKNIIFAFSKH